MFSLATIVVYYHPQHSICICILFLWHSITKKFAEHFLPFGGALELHRAHFESPWSKMNINLNYAPYKCFLFLISESVKQITYCFLVNFNFYIAIGKHIFLWSWPFRNSLVVPYELIYYSQLSPLDCPIINSPSQN